MPSNQHAERVGRNVRAEMARLGLSQAAVAPNVGMTQQALSRRISGRTGFKIDELARVAAFLNVSITDLISHKASV